MLPLTAGRYVLCSAAGRGAATETELDVRAGEVTSLMLEVSPSNAVTVREDAQGLALDTLGTDTSCSSCHARPEDR